MEIVVKPLPLHKWHNKTGKESFTREKPVKALVDPYTMKYKTGLSDSDIEALKKKGVNYDLSSNFSENVPHPFWDSKIAKVKLPNSTKIFNTDRVIDFIYYHILLDSKFVANSLNEWEKGEYPYATHYIHNDAKQIEAKATKRQLITRATIAVDKLGIKDKLILILNITDRNLSAQSDEFVEVALGEIIDSKPGQVLEILKGDKKFYSSKAIVKECLQKSILVKKGHKIFYLDSYLGDTEADVADYLNDTQNQELKIKLIEFIKSK